MMLVKMVMMPEMVMVSMAMMVMVIVVTTVMVATSDGHRPLCACQTLGHSVVLIPRAFSLVLGDHMHSGHI